MDAHGSKAAALPNIDGLPLAEDLWLSQQLRRPVYRVHLDQRPSATAEPPTGSFLYARLPQDSLTEVGDLIRRGFSLIEVSVTLDMDPFAVPPGEMSTQLGVRIASELDVGAISEIARRSLTHSRFHRDPTIDPAVASELKSAWAANLGRGERGLACWVVEWHGRVIGFLGATAVPHQATSVAIDLIATDPDYQRTGAGTALVEELRRWAAAGGFMIRTSTQMKNVSAIRFYEACGFRFGSSELLLHAHLGRSAS
jgi:GNAT superfamily N-acetyltransferase